jgi:cytochrome P450
MGRDLTDEELLSMFVLLFLGGMDTVTNMTGFTFQYLAQRPDLQEQLANNPSLMSDFVEESVRLFGVVSLARYVAKDCSRFGVEMRAGEMVACMQPLVGRDERLNSDPQTFDIARRNRHHLTFGGGAHLCVGHLLARAELKVLTEEWLRRVPRFELVPDAPINFRLGQVVAMLSLPLQWNVEDSRSRQEFKGPLAA